MADYGDRDRSYFLDERSEAGNLSNTFHRAYDAEYKRLSKNGDLDRSGFVEYSSYDEKTSDFIQGECSKRTWQMLNDYLEDRNDYNLARFVLGKVLSDTSSMSIEAALNATRGLGINKKTLKEAIDDWTVDIFKLGRSGR